MGAFKLGRHERNFLVVITGVIGAEDFLRSRRNVSVAWPLYCNRSMTDGGGTWVALEGLSVVAVEFSPLDVDGFSSVCVGVTMCLFVTRLVMTFSMRGL